MSLSYKKFVSEDDDQEEKPKIHHLSITVDEALSTDLKKQQEGFLKCTVCCGVVAAVILIVAVVMLVLGFTVLHVKHPKLTMNSVTIIGLDGFNATDLLNGNANLTVVADVSVKNTNVAAFKFENFNSSLVYHETVVGVADVPGGVVKARKTMRLNLAVEVMVAKIAGDLQLRRDLAAGNLTVRSYTRIHGRVKILNIIKRKVTVTMICSIAVNLTSGIADQDCESHGSENDPKEKVAFLVQLTLEKDEDVIALARILLKNLTATIDDSFEKMGSIKSEAYSSSSNNYEKCVADGLRSHRLVAGNLTICWFIMKGYFWKKSIWKGISLKVGFFLKVKQEQIWDLFFIWWFGRIFGALEGMFIET